MTNFEKIILKNIDEMADFITLIIIGYSCGIFGFSDMSQEMIRESPLYNEMFKEMKRFLESEADNE